MNFLTTTSGLIFKKDLQNIHDRYQQDTKNATEDFVTHRLMKPDELTTWEDTTMLSSDIIPGKSKHKKEKLSFKAKIEKWIDDKQLLVSKIANGTVKIKETINQV